MRRRNDGIKEENTNTGFGFDAAIPSFIQTELCNISITAIRHEFWCFLGGFGPKAACIGCAGFYCLIYEYWMGRGFGSIVKLEESFVIIVAKLTKLGSWSSAFEKHLLVY